MHRFRCLQLGLALLALALAAPAAAQPFDDDPMADPTAEPQDDPADVPFGSDPAAQPQPEPQPQPRPRPAPAVEPSADTDLEAFVPWVAGASYITGLEWGIDPAPAPDAGPVEFHGYLRSTFGANGKLGAMVPFAIPFGGLPLSNFYLGNSDLTYGEAQLVGNWGSEGGAWFRAVMTASLITSFDEEFGDAAINLRELYAQAGNVLAGSPELSFWAGQRYYRRHEVHLTDFFLPFQTSAYGAGLQGVDLGFGKLAVAYLGQSLGTNTDNGEVLESNVDVRMYQIPAGNGFLQAGLTLALAPGGETAPGVDTGAVGFALDATLLSLGVLGGYNKLTVEVGTGPARDFGQYAVPAVDDSGGALRLRLTDTLLMMQSPGMSLLGLFLFQYNDDGDVEGTDPFFPFDGTWVSAGVRPVFHLGTYTAITTEAALDFVDPSGFDSGLLGKLTVAPTIRGGNGFWARPEIRAFLTAAFWDSDLEGNVGGPAYADDQFGLSFGVQAESWW